MQFALIAFEPADFGSVPSCQVPSEANRTCHMNYTRSRATMGAVNNRILRTLAETNLCSVLQFNQIASLFNLLDVGIKPISERCHGDDNLLGRFGDGPVMIVTFKSKK